MPELCQEHSGFKSDIETNKRNISELWEKYDKMSDKIDGIMTRLNVILGGIVVACIMFVLNIIFEVV